MTSDRFLRWCARSYAQLRLVLSARDTRERHAIGGDGERLLNAAHAHGRLTLATTYRPRSRDEDVRSVLLKNVLRLRKQITVPS